MNLEISVLKQKLKNLYCLYNCTKDQSSPVCRTVLNCALRSLYRTKDIEIKRSFPDAHENASCRKWYGWY